MAVTTAKKTTKSTSKSAAKTSKTVKKTAATKKTSTTRKRATKKRTVSAEERYKMTEVAAYFIAENHNFQGNPTDFWIAAEAEVNEKLAA